MGDIIAKLKATELPGDISPPKGTWNRLLPTQGNTTRKAFAKVFSLWARRLKIGSVSGVGVSIPILQVGKIRLCKGDFIGSGDCRANYYEDDLSLQEMKG